MKAGDRRCKDCEEKWQGRGIVCNECRRMNAQSIKWNWVARKHREMEKMESQPGVPFVVCSLLRGGVISNKSFHGWGNPWRVLHRNPVPYSYNSVLRKIKEC